MSILLAIPGGRQTTAVQNALHDTGMLTSPWYINPPAYKAFQVTIIVDNITILVVRLGGVFVGAGKYEKYYFYYAKTETSISNGLLFFVISRSVSTHGTAILMHSSSCRSILHLCFLIGWGTVGVDTGHWHADTRKCKGPVSHHQVG